METYEERELSIDGFRGAPVANTLYWHGKAVTRLLIVLPGLRYNAFMPLLYYPIQIALAKGADVLRVEQAYPRPYADALRVPDFDEHLKADCVATVRAGMAQRSYERIIIAGKSTGTIAMALALGLLPDERLSFAWLTPLLNREDIGRRLIQQRPRSLFVAGTSDYHFKRHNMESIAGAVGGKLMVFDGANHALEVGGDMGSSLAVMQLFLREFERFAFE